jgi:hypothetical protein
MEDSVTLDDMVIMRAVVNSLMCTPKPRGGVDILHAHKVVSFSNAENFICEKKNLHTSDRTHDLVNERLPDPPVITK